MKSFVQRFIWHHSRPQNKIVPPSTLAKLANITSHLETTRKPKSTYLTHPHATMSKERADCWTECFPCKPQKNCLSEDLEFQMPCIECTRNIVPSLCHVLDLKVGMISNAFNLRHSRLTSCRLTTSCLQASYAIVSKGHPCEQYCEN